MPIGDYCFALPLAIGNYSDLNLIDGEPWRQKHVLYPPRFYVIGRQQPKSLFSIAALGRKHDAIALGALWRMNETRRPARRPFYLAHRPEKGRYISDGTFQYNRNDCVRCSSPATLIVSALTGQI